jgi:hypothetical protein
MSTRSLCGIVGNQSFHERSAIKPAAQRRFDQVSLGEVMLRLDPGEGRLRGIDWPDGPPLPS